METEGMTRERLEAYRSNNDEIKELQGKLQKMGTEEGKEKLVESDTIIDYRKGYPRPQTVTDIIIAKSSACGRDIPAGSRSFRRSRRRSNSGSLKLRIAKFRESFGYVT